MADFVGVVEEMSDSDVSALLRHAPEEESSEDERVHLRVVQGHERGMARAQTIQIKRVPAEERARLRDEVPEAAARDYYFPKVRAECVPCPACQLERERLDKVRMQVTERRLACGHVGLEVIAHSRPCIFVGCAMNNFVDVHGRTGNLRLSHPDLAPGQMARDDSCALDVAAEEGATLERVARATAVTRERVRQWEEAILRKLALPASRLRR